MTFIKKRGICGVWILIVFWISVVNAEFHEKVIIKEKDLLRKSIVFDKKTPDVFYCPTHKPSAMNKLIVRSRPLHKLCEFEGLPLPEDYKSDCYKDLDETEYACKEKYRIMKRVSKDEITTHK